MRNASDGDIVDNTAIPPHEACIIVQTALVNDSQWDEPAEPITFRNLPHSLYRLQGDVVSFDPTPTGGAPNIFGLPRADCAAGRVLRQALRVAPSAADVAAHIEIPATANLIVVRNIHDAQLALLSVNDGTSLVVRRFGGTTERRLSFIGVDPRVIVANVDVPLAIAGPEDAVDDDHGKLYCPMFDESDNPPPFAMHGDLGGNLLFLNSVVDTPRLPESVRAVRTRRRRPFDRLGDFLTLGSGCSNSQYP
jgi:hypothetical protein